MGKARINGRSSNRLADEELKQEILESYQEKYAGFGPTLAAEAGGGRVAVG
jgi:hypothetical protein